MLMLRILAVTFLMLLAGYGVAPGATQRPNIVLIFTDDHGYQAISAYNESRKLVQTPNIDRLYREGMRFDRCLVPNSICGPSRATVLTGKYSHKNGFYNNSNCRFDGSQQTFVKLLGTAGYQTAVIGKWHLISDPVGFDHWNILPGQGIYYNPTLIEKGKPTKHTGYATDIISDLSVDWIRKRDKSRPFVLMSQHKAPHREWAPPLRYLGHDHDRQYPEPATLFENYQGRGFAVQDQDMTLEKTMTPLDVKLTRPADINPEQTLIWDAYYGPRNAAYLGGQLQGAELIRWRYNRYMHDYLGTVRGVDDAVGKMLHCLEEEGLADNTIVIYCADQGFYLGEHGWFDKRWIFEESLRTPLLVRWPGVIRPGSVSGEITSTVDLAQTFLEMAGVPSPADMQGRSLVPVMRGQTPADWRKSFYYHYYEFPVPHRVRPHEGVVTGQYKLVHFYKPDVDYWELYDRQADPLEVKSFYGDPKYQGVVAQLTQELKNLRKDLDVPAETPPEAYGGPPRRLKK